jgi:hypothetical protein
MKRISSSFIHDFALIFVFALASLFLCQLLICDAKAGQVEDESVPKWDEIEGRYEISSASAFSMMRDWVNEGKSADLTYGLTADIDLQGMEWTPIGPCTVDSGGKITGTPFKGKFEGNGHSVENFKITSADYTLAAAGLFAFVSPDVAGGGIRDLSVIGFDIQIVATAESKYGLFLFAGGLAANNRGDISGCYAVGAVKFTVPQSKKACFGVLAGFSSGTIRNCYAAGPVSLVDGKGEARVGGLLGQNDIDGLMSFSFADSDVTASGDRLFHAGGLVGNNVGRMTDSCAKTNILAGLVSSGTMAAGGLVGRNDGDMDRCYAAGSVFSSSKVNALSYFGGLVGYNMKSIKNSYSLCGVSAVSPAFLGGLAGHNKSMSAEINTSYASGLVTGSAVKGGLVGKNDEGLINGCVWQLPGSGNDLGIGRDEGPNNVIDQAIDARSLDEDGFKNRSSFAGQGWNFDSIWGYSDINNGQRPVLRAFFDEDDLDALKADMSVLVPGKVDIGAGESRLVKFTAACEIGSIVITPEKRAGVTIMRHVSSPDIIVVSADAHTARDVFDVSVEFAINGISQNAKKLMLAVAGNSDPVDLPESSEPEAGDPDSADPSEQTKPDGPSEPEDANDPVDSTDPIDQPNSEDPAEPAAPPGPINPPGPENPAEPVDTPELTKPDDPSEPIDMPSLDDPPEPVSPPAPLNPPESENPAEPVDPPMAQEPINPPVPVNPNDSLEPNIPVSPMEPLYPILPSDPDLPLDDEASRPLPAILEELNEAFQAVAIGVIGLPGEIGSPIAEVDRVHSSFEFIDYPDGGPGHYAGHVPLYGSLRVRVPLRGGTKGDTLALSYNIRLYDNQLFRGWEEKDDAGRYGLIVENGLTAAYESYGGSGFLSLIEEGSLRDWEAALSKGAAVFTEEGVSINFAVVDGPGDPRLEDAIIVIPDGVLDMEINASLCFFVRAGNANEFDGGDQGSGAILKAQDGSGGCGVGFGHVVLAASAVIVSVRRRARRGPL